MRWAGNGAVAKLCHNLIGLASNHVLAEGFTLAVKAGLDPEVFLEVLRGGAYGKQIGLKHSIPEVIFKGDFDTPRFAFALARKDVGLATDLAREYNVPMPLSNVAEQNMIEGMNRGWGGRGLLGRVTASGGASRRRGPQAVGSRVVPWEGAIGDRQSALSS